MFRSLLPVVVLLLLLASRVEASPINLLLTVDYDEPVYGLPPISLSFRFFESAFNGWQSIPKPPTTSLVRSGANLLPGVTQFEVSLDADTLEDVYFSASGSYQVFSPLVTLGAYVAEPPTGRVSDQLVSNFGAPWIPLENLGGGFSGDFGWTFGGRRTSGDGSVGGCPSGC